MCVYALEEKLPAEMFSLKLLLFLFLMINGFSSMRHVTFRRALIKNAMTLQLKCNTHLTAVKHKFKKKKKKSSVFIELDFFF